VCTSFKSNENHSVKNAREGGDLYFAIIGPEAGVCTVVQFSIVHSKQRNQLKHQINEDNIFLLEAIASLVVTFSLTHSLTH
jgi:hypothetical protein